MVQARTGSTRLPGKVLADLHGRPMLGFLLDRLGPLRVNNLVVATSALPQDHPVAEVAADRHVDVVRGSESDVLDRFARALDAFPADVVIRITADCPLSDPAIIEAAVELQAATGADYVSNSLVRTFPVGLDVEVVTAKALLEAASQADDQPEREHVMPFIYRRPERYRLVNLRTDALLGAERWTVDTPVDLERVRGIVSRLADPIGAGWQDMLAAAPHDGDTGDDGPLIRPAVAADDASIAALAADPGAIALGPAAPQLPVAEHLLDGQRRTWVVESGGSLGGWVQVTVTGGVGRLSGHAWADEREAVLASLRQLLATDYQVEAWEPGTWPTNEREFRGS